MKTSLRDNVIAAREETHLLRMQLSRAPEQAVNTHNIALAHALEVEAELVEISQHGKIALPRDIAQMAAPLVTEIDGLLSDLHADPSNQYAHGQLVKTVARIKAIR
jgi:hypothetical protein